MQQGCKHTALHSCHIGGILLQGAGIIVRHPLHYHIRKFAASHQSFVSFLDLLLSGINPLGYVIHAVLFRHLLVIELLRSDVLEGFAVAVAEDGCVLEVVQLH